MYRFKAFYKDGTTQIFGTSMDTPNELYFDFDGCMKWEDYYSFYDNDVSTKDILEVAFKVFKNTLKKEYYRIEIINDETNEIIDYIEK